MYTPCKPHIYYMSRIMRKPDFCICETKAQISFAVTAKLISAFVFATRIVQTLYYLNLKFQASSHLLWLYSTVCVGPGRKPRRPVFSQRGSYNCGVQGGINCIGMLAWCGSRDTDNIPPTLMGKSSRDSQNTKSQVLHVSIHLHRNKSCLKTEFSIHTYKFYPWRHVFSWNWLNLELVHWQHSTMVILMVLVVCRTSTLLLHFQHLHFCVFCCKQFTSTKCISYASDRPLSALRYHTLRQASPTL